MIFPSTFLFTTNPSCLMLRDGVDFRGQFSRGWLRNHRRLNVGADQYIQPFRTALAASASHSHSLCRSSRTCLRIGVATARFIQRTIGIQCTIYLRSSEWQWLVGEHPNRNKRGWNRTDQSPIRAMLSIPLQRLSLAQRPKPVARRFVHSV